MINLIPVDVVVGKVEFGDNDGGSGGNGESGCDDNENVFICIQMHKNTSIHAWMYTRILHMHIWTTIHTYIHYHTYTYAHIRKCSNVHAYEQKYTVYAHVYIHT